MNNTNIVRTEYNYLCTYRVSDSITHPQRQRINIKQSDGLSRTWRITDETRMGGVTSQGSFRNDKPLGYQRSATTNYSQTP